MDGSKTKKSTTNWLKRLIRRGKEKEMKPMFKTELIQRLSDKTGYTNLACKEILQAFIDVVTASVRRGRPVQITNFGTFKRVHRKARTYKGFDGKITKAKCINAPHFTPGERFKKEVR